MTNKGIHKPPRALNRTIIESGLFVSQSGNQFKGNRLLGMVRTHIFPQTKTLPKLGPRRSMPPLLNTGSRKKARFLVLFDYKDIKGIQTR